VLRFGYTFGEGAHIEIMPYVLYLCNPELYPHDFFLQGMEELVPHERTVLVYFLSLFRGFLQQANLLLHFLSTVVLLLGMERLARHFIANKYLAWLAILMCLIPFYLWTIGGNDLYYSDFQASNLALAIGMWSIVALVERKLIIAVTIATITTFIHPIVGLVLIITFLGMFLYEWIAKGTVAPATFLQSIGIFGLTAAVYLLVMYLNRGGEGDMLVADRYFDILFRFRHPHHYIFFAFPMTKRLFFIGLMFVAVAFFGKHSKTISTFILVSIVIMIGYIIAVDILEITFIANFQWYKVTVFLKFFGFIAVFGFLEQYVPKLREWLRFPTWFEYSGMIVLSAGIAVLIFNYPSASPLPVSYQFGDHTQRDPEIALAKEVMAQTPRDAVLIQPFSNTSLKYYSRRSSFVSFKSPVKSRSYMDEWYERIQEVYGLSVSMKQKGFNLKKEADRYFMNHDSSTLEPLKAKGVTHIFTWQEHKLEGYQIVAENDEFAVYKL
jgi:hypothetical protein